MQISTEMSLGGWKETGTSMYGEALAMLGQEAEGIDKIRQGNDFNLALGVRCTMLASIRALGDVYARNGQLEESLSTLDEALNLIDETSEHHWESEIYRLRGKTLQLMDDDQGAEANFRQAVDIARGQNAKSWELRAATDLARLWYHQGKTEQARQVLAEIYDWFTEGFDTPDLVAARILLEELESSRGI